MHLALLFVVGLAGTARCKSLGFGPNQPNVIFHSSPYTNVFLPMSPDTDPFDVANRFVKDILGTCLTESMAYRICNDSYTDSSTGITHVYIHQVVNGLEVTNGNMNINVKDGIVMLYGTSVSLFLGYVSIS